MAVAVEVAVGDLDGVRVARAGGATRVELSAALELGGLTPSLALVEAAVAAAGDLGVHVLLRPRPGSFVHSADDVALVLRDAELALAAGAAGLVVGPVLADGTVDVAALQRFRAAAGDRDLTFHRAFDGCADLKRAVADLVTCGVTRVLTSGGAAGAHAGADRIRRTVEAAAGRLGVMAGGGVRPDALPALLAATGVRDVHLSARTPDEPDRGFGPRSRTDPSIVAAAVRAVTPRTSAG
ncbi:copper homeostasis protein CutC [Kineococcus rubinsiae]|uniref:copper homeostasis protein CutC n=1 Tax=Kineococcus rubinsiae TaxID=2609562 RepID=UPI001430DEF3|nr:copper homeostasis protein CutC [Kineococcus rubinsiae]NIZ90655.1 copper homeostasis protein CutC [Kineococcus rubinsiae]